MKKFNSIREESLLEKLKSSDPTGEWIHDFVKSDNPKFAGKSKQERIRMALGASYAARRNEEVEIDEQMAPPKGFRRPGDDRGAEMGAGGGGGGTTTSKVWRYGEGEYDSHRHAEPAASRLRPEPVKAEPVKSDLKTRYDAEMEKIRAGNASTKKPDYPTLTDVIPEPSKNSKPDSMGRKEPTMGEPVNPPDRMGRREPTMGEPSKKLTSRQITKSLREPTGPVAEDLDMKKTAIPVGVIDGPGGYEEAQKRIKDYEDGKINKDGKQLPPIEDRSKPSDKLKTKAVAEELDAPKTQASQIKDMLSNPQHTSNPEHKSQLEKRYKIAKDREDLDQGQAVDKTGKVMPVLPPADFAKKNPNFNKESVEDLNNRKALDEIAKKIKIKINYPKETAQEKLYRTHQEKRKKIGLPDPSQYKQYAAQKQAEIDAMKNEAAKPGLYANIQAKRKRIAAGSNERMRKPGTKGAPTAQAFKDAAKTAKK